MSGDGETFIAFDTSKEKNAVARLAIGRAKSGTSAGNVSKVHVWTAPAVQGGVGGLTKRSGAIMMEWTAPLFPTAD
jgi:hypothetical protein